MTSPKLFHSASLRDHGDMSGYLDLDVMTCATVVFVAHQFTESHSPPSTPRCLAGSTLPQLARRVKHTVGGKCKSQPHAFALSLHFLLLLPVFPSKVYLSVSLSILHSTLSAPYMPYSPLLFSLLHRKRRRCALALPCRVA